jgi:predicted ATP-dependent protease
LLLNIPINNKIAITGEIDLNGKVLSVGGLEYKIEGAKIAGVTKVYCPLENKNEIDKIRSSKFSPEDENFSIILIDNIYDILDEVFIYKIKEEEDKIKFNKINYL